MSWIRVQPKDRQSRQERRSALLASITPEEEARINQRQLPPAPSPFMTLEEALADVDLEACYNDFPDVNPDDVAHDVIINMQLMVHPRDRKEFRERLGLYI